MRGKKHSIVDHYFTLPWFLAAAMIKIFSSDCKTAVHLRSVTIKFAGPRLPKPKFDRSSFPPLPLIIEQGKKTSVNKREVINESEMPAFLRRKAISEEECAAINAGGAYGL
ncbi:unnamed protein product [Dracunculus medinensis]|uniref:Uncharacterized protein n=1 Tax=Dracunculus medinensis TaxID=318479 RepID=A0A0N4UGX4_DRAME|nr:unnamed protein product [Dracunculus medinensis]